MFGFVDEAEFFFPSATRFGVFFLELFYADFC